MHEIDFEKPFSSILRFESLKMLLTFATYHNFEIEQMNVSDAYLKNDFKKTIYMKIFEKYEILKKNQILRLLKFLYDLKLLV